MHLWLRANHPAAAWTLTSMSLVTLAWLALDYQRMGRETIRVDNGMLTVRIGLRATAEVDISAVAQVLRPTWRDIPEPGSADAKGYLDLTKPASPNVLIILDQSWPVVIAGAVRVPTRRIGLHLDDPDGFLTEINKGRVLAPVAAR
jgi:hypothetical protein